MDRFLMNRGARSIYEPRPPPVRVHNTLNLWRLTLSPALGPVPASEDLERGASLQLKFRFKLYKGQSHPP